MGRTRVRLECQVAFGPRVRARRTQHGWSQMALAEVLGLHFTYVSQIERGERNLSLVNILKVAKALGVDPGELVQGIDPPPPVGTSGPAE